MVAIASVDALAEAMLRTNVNWFSDEVTGMPYSKLKQIIYPRPPYKHFTIKKRNGNPRMIAEPKRRLKIIQEKILAFLQDRSNPAKPTVHGFVAKRSIVTNAIVHCSPRTQYILNLDLQDFFPSIAFRRVRGVLTNHPFNFSFEVATVIAQICTLDDALPQGASTSPFISNLVCRSMDRDLNELARRNLAIYTRYADDITFSFTLRNSSRLPAAICVAEHGGGVTIGSELHNLITNTHHFAINPSKTRLNDRFRRMEVTGLTINERPNVRRIFVDRIRGALNAWERNGYDNADAQWQFRVSGSSGGANEKRVWKRQTRKGKPPQLKNVLWGKLLYLRMVRGKDDALYNRLAKRYNFAVEVEKAMGPFVAPKLPVQPELKVVRDHDTALDAVYVLEWAADYQSTPGHTDDQIIAQGTAFAYRENNLLLTCNHIFEASASVGKHDYPVDFDGSELVNRTLSLIRPGTKQSWPAQVIYRNKAFDFAIVQFVGDPPAHRYFPAMIAPIKARSDGILVGFPAYQQWNLPDFNDQKVLNRTEPNKGMLSFSISGAGSIRPGNSGGPFVDKNFHVAGMAQRGAYMGKGHDECLCFQIIDMLIEKWKSVPKPLATRTTSLPISTTATGSIVSTTVTPP